MNELKDSVIKYFERIDETVFPRRFKEKATVILSGSTGWGIKEGFDEKADWDLHILLSDEAYIEFKKEYGENYVIDDHENNPIVFAQIHNKDWLITRLKNEETKILYLWIYTNCIYLKDELKIYKNEIKNEKEKFVKEITKNIKKHYIKFAVRRLDSSSCAKRNLEVSTSINKAEMVKWALELLSLLKNEPYPYTKWLFKHVSILYLEDIDINKILELIEKILKENKLIKLIPLIKELKINIETILERIYGEERWIKYWWEFNKN